MDERALHPPSDDPARETDSAAPTTADAPPELGISVTLEAFSGPLDLLLYLVRRAEVDIADIPIAQITDQFIAILQASEHANLDVAGDFILMAATLLEIKARMIAPVAESADEAADEEDDSLAWADPRAGLVAQLLAFRAAKEQVQSLESLELAAWQRHGRRLREEIPEDPEEAGGISLDNADPYVLFQAWDKILKSIAGHSPRTVQYNDVPIEERVRRIHEVMKAAGEGRLSWLLAEAGQTIQRVGVVVATLESIRKRFIEAIQHEQYGDVYLRYRDEDERQREPLLPPEDPGPAKRRRRRLPLITWHPPAAPLAPASDATDAAAASTDDDTAEDDSGDDELPDEPVVESDEQRFLRELEEACGVDAILTRVSRLDAALEEHLVAVGVLDAPPAVEPAAPATVDPGA
jgi:segregation and condensation protein A